MQRDILLLTVDLDNLAARRAGLIVLPDKPYPFCAGDGPEMFPNQLVALAGGRSLIWHGALPRHHRGPADRAAGGAPSGVALMPG